MWPFSGAAGFRIDSGPCATLFDHQDYDPGHVVTAEARAADLHVLECWERGDHAAVCDFYPEYRRHAPEGRFAHYLMLLGALGGRACEARGERYSAYENAIGTGQVHMVFDLETRHTRHTGR